MNASAIGLPGTLRGSWYEGQRVISYLSAAYSAGKGGIRHRNVNAFKVVEGNRSSVCSLASRISPGFYHQAVANALSVVLNSSTIGLIKSATPGIAKTLSNSGLMVGIN
jgi:hypothetical protein